ncbi:MAG TPA: hypothetical protein VM344_01790 [Vitreimonas sp.]|nr:hypothetical protein [Vitreimonas sp.]
MASRPDIHALKAHLLAIDGRGFQVDWFLDEELRVPEVELLLEAGHLDSTEHLTVRPMDLAECHRNVRRLAAADSTVSWRFGMALSSDDIWRVHSWALRRGRIVETTLPRTRYYGIDMGRLMDLRRHPPRNVTFPDPYVHAARALGAPRSRLGSRVRDGIRRLRTPNRPHAGGG